MSSLNINVKPAKKCGYGSGYGYGYGDGDGDGDGYGSGDGDGDGLAAFCGQAVHRIDGINTLIDHVHGNVARGRVVNADLTTTPCYIAKSGHYFAHGETLASATAALEEKLLDDMPVEQKIAEFKRRFSPGQKYPARDYYNWHHLLTGSCEMGRRQFAKDRGIDIESAEFTPEEFMEMTKNAFGGSVIRRLMKEWE